MSGPHSPHVTQVNLRFPETLYAKFQKRARELGMTATDVLTAYMVSQTTNTTLTNEEYAECMRRIEERKAKLARKNGKH